MDSRREFLKKAALLSGGAGLFATLPASLARALAINPMAGSTWLDAEHVVILMQENRSFDHCYGSLSGVRGFNDPRAIPLPDGDPVWFQKNKTGAAYAPFRLNIKDTNSTWTGSLPHSWTNQVDARNNGALDQWLIAKPSGNPAFAQAPLTMGYYSREDIPFYYALADAFTVCDQNFSSALTGTTPNRLFLWTGSVRAAQAPESYANVRNENVEYDNEASWTTFPERLEDHGISWKIYQNELSIQTGFTGEEDSWLANFTDNPIEWFSQYNVRFSATHRRYMAEVLQSFPARITELEQSLAQGTHSEKEIINIKKELRSKNKILSAARVVAQKFTDEAYAALDQRSRNLHEKAFATNAGDNDYRSVEQFHYDSDEGEKTMTVPKGDVLYQFRKDVNEGKLPSVSWVVGPENFSDHPGAPWYGAWYVSEIMDILTKKPDVWKKTIFILCYDENDGYFDHVPPFVPPDPYTKHSGKVSAGIDTLVEFVTLEQDAKRSKPDDCRHSPVGLGYRVPLVIASPWSRGGHVCSQVFDHTSIIMMMETWLTHKTGKTVKEPNISAWRRTVCGDLSATFTPYNDEPMKSTAFIGKADMYQSIYAARFKKNPTGYRQLTSEDIAKWKPGAAFDTGFRQEPGTRPACALPYELTVNGNYQGVKEKFFIEFESGKKVFGDKSAGAPYIVYAFNEYNEGPDIAAKKMRAWNYAVKAGDLLTDSWNVKDFVNETYHLAAYGPNGFFREFRGTVADPELIITCEYAKDKKGRLSGDIDLVITNTGKASTLKVIIREETYHTKSDTLSLRPLAVTRHRVRASDCHGWYDVSVTITGFELFLRQFAGHVETGSISSSDPAMAGLMQA